MFVVNSNDLKFTIYTVELWNNSVQIQTSVILIMKLLLLCIFSSFIFAANAGFRDKAKGAIEKLKRQKDPVSDDLLLICERFKSGQVYDV